MDIPEATLSLEQIKEHCDAEDRLRRQPSLCTSHTVIVVDHSASMKTSDVTELAGDFVAKQRLSGVAADTDVVSLVLMDDWVTVVFERDPMGLVPYNKLVGLHLKASPCRTATSCRYLARLRSSSARTKTVAPSAFSSCLTEGGQLYRCGGGELSGSSGSD